MQTVVSYIKKVIIFRHHKREVYTPIYKDIGKGQVKDKALKIDLKRET